ncbi:hypothetical protein L6164_011355 [Bauhinia variegata]|uniref:Uncharacterized protein n=1 Tax=Bauhinia variegata TaxID=167791 RepID=A0ACB9P5N0_BAUVA|nr:hypothetical protein L6164_011355 [Bauhinia variegata]
MASATLVPIGSAGIRACATSGHRKPDNDRRKNSSTNWWTPIFGWSSDPDYIDTNNKDRPGDRSESKPSRPRFARGCLTEEKARQLRLMTMETESFHDTMYHSAIASRLASDFKNNSDP